MGLHLTPPEWQPVREERRIRVGEIGEERRVVRDGIQWLGHGALVCPSCAIPIALSEPVSIATRLRCGFCEHDGRAREFVVRDVFDTISNEVYLVARVA